MIYKVSNPPQAARCVCQSEDKERAEQSVGWANDCSVSIIAEEELFILIGGEKRLPPTIALPPSTSSDGCEEQTRSICLSAEAIFEIERPSQSPHSESAARSISSFLILCLVPSPRQSSSLWVDVSCVSDSKANVVKEDQTYFYLQNLGQRLKPCMSSLPTDVWRWPKWRGARGVCTFPSVSFGAIAKNGDAAVRGGGEEGKGRGEGEDMFSI